MRDFISFSACLVGAFWFCALALQVSAEPDYGYGLMMDAGSTGSRIHVYRWIRHPGASIPEFTDDFFAEVKPGVSSFKDDPKKAGPSLDKLITFALDKVPQDKRATTTVHLKATAGLRLLPEDVQHALLESVRDTLQATPFIFDRSWVSVISGVEEAVGAWVTVNYLLGKLEKGVDTVGITDLGGASVQVACLPTEAPAPESLRHVVTVGGRSYPLYVKSHLGYGLMQGRLGIKRVSEVYSAGDANGNVNNACFPKGYKVKVGDKTHVGGSSYQMCVAVADDYMSTGGTEIPLTKVSAVQTRGDFLGFSYIYDVLSVYDMTKNLHRPSLEEVQAKAKEVCSLDYQKLQEKFSGKFENEDFLAHACTDLVYIASLMKNLMRLDTAETRMFVGKRIEDKELSWTLGAMLAVMKDHEPQIDTSRVIAVGVTVVASLAVYFLLNRKRVPPTKAASASKKSRQD